MNIKKLGHCCLLIKMDGLTILTDPGAFTTSQNAVTGIDVILITHEHADHLHVGSLTEVLKNNPQAKVISNTGVGKKLDEAGIKYTIVEGSMTTKLGATSTILLEAFDCKHVEIFEEFGQVQNTGYLIGSKLFYPGDSYCEPKKPVDVLALPVSGPWCKVADAIRYALAVKPKKAFPVHDGNLQKDRIGGSHAVPAKILAEHGIEFVAMNEGDERGF